VYPDPHVESFIKENFIPARFHVKTHPEAMARFGVDWTPTILILDSDGQERHRIEGFLPKDDFLAQVMLGRAHVAFKKGRFEEAESHYREIVARLPDTDAAAEALYWAGVSRYKATADAVALKQTAEAFKTQYTDSTWAKKASIWS
jgi:thioredoxin-like negative regulator of GroEL